MDITPESRVGQILDAYPETEIVFTEMGFTELKNPIMRATVAKYATLNIASAKKNIDVDILINRLHAAINKTSP